MTFYELEQTDKYAHATTDEINELTDAIFATKCQDKLNAKQAFDTLMKDTALVKWKRQLKGYSVNMMKNGGN